MAKIRKCRHLAVAIWLISTGDCSIRPSSELFDVQMLSAVSRKTCPQQNDDPFPLILFI